MAAATSIEWTNMTWNPVTGCDKVSDGCRNCYAETMAHRLRLVGSPRYANGFQVTLHHDMLNVPHRWRKPRKIFVNSMSDLLHPDVPDDFIAAVLETIAATPRHTYQVLTKRPYRALNMAEALEWPPNLWLGVSVERAKYAFRIRQLAQLPAAVRFVSAEPLLEPLPDLDLQSIDWLIAGGESGPGARPVDGAWIRDLRDQCHASDTAFFFKQWGGVRKKTAGRLLDGREHLEFPAPAG